MATCRDCGKEVSWAKRENGSTHPPIEYIGSVLVVINGIVQDAPSYKYHRCDPEEIENWQVHATEQMRWKEERDQELAWQWRLALRYACPKCGVKRREKCLNLTKAHQGIKQEVIWPHPDRVKLNPKWVPLHEREQDAQTQAGPKSPANPDNGSATQA